MINDQLKHQVLNAIFRLQNKGFNVVIVHGGGPFIQNTLDLAGIKSTFIGGHRQTSAEAMIHVEMALKGRVNAMLVGTLSKLGCRAIGLSGKDGQLVRAKKREHIDETTNKPIELGHVGDVEAIDTRIVETLIRESYIPVVACVAADESGKTYNINADMFAGHLAGALKVDSYVVLTDVDGLLMDKNDASSLIKRLALNEIDDLIQKGIIVGGMLPKMESCRVALDAGAVEARIINGTKPEQIEAANTDRQIGTEIYLNQ